MKRQPRDSILKKMYTTRTGVLNSQPALGGSVGLGPRIVE